MSAPSYSRWATVPAAGATFIADAFAHTDPLVSLDAGRHLMTGDTMVGDGGNLTIYERPDGSRYALDKRGKGREWPSDGALFGRARFDSRPLASGRWEGSRSSPGPVE